IDSQPPDVGPGLRQLELQQVVDHDDDVVDVGEEIADAGAYPLRHDLAVEARGRLYHQGVDPVVESVDAAIERLQRVARVAVGGAARKQRQRKRCASGERAEARKRVNGGGHYGEV